MILQTILVIILLFNLRKRTKNDSSLYKWDRLIISGIVCSSALLVASFTTNKPGALITILSYSITAAVLYSVFTEKLFAALKPMVWAFLPLLAMNFVEDMLAIINKPFYRQWATYLEIAEFFALIWMIGMLIVTGKQRKALENERRINEEKEKEFRISEKLKAELEVQVKERTAEITRQKEELQQALHELESTQSQLIHSEKMASLGELTAGIAHEIQNPLNFVNNFSEINQELLAELIEEINKGNTSEAKAIAGDLIENETKINHHGKRADSIVKGMLQHSRTSTGQKEPTDINALCDECLRLSYHGLRAKDKTFNAAFETRFQEGLPKINVVPQEVGRVLLNMCNNAFYAVTKRKKSEGADYKPVITISTSAIENNQLEIRIADNGSGIPAHVIDKIFQPFFTTKPTGEGTGLGLSMSYDIITKGHNGPLSVESEENEGSTFIIHLPYLNNLTHENSSS